MYSPKSVAKEAHNIEDLYLPNPTETRALLDVEQSRFEIMLQRLYYSP